MGFFAKKGLPRSHLLWRPLGTFTTIGTEVFSWGTCNQVTVLGCGCERQSEQFEQGKTCCHMNYTFFYSITKEGIVGKPSTFFLAAFCLMQCLSQHLRERYSLKSCPPDISLVLEMVPATPEHASLTQCPAWISFPRRACLETICFGGHWGLARQLEQKFFLEARAIKSPFLPVRTKDSPNNSNKERLAIWTYMNYVYNNSFLKNQTRYCWQTVNILSCSFLPDAVFEPTPPGTVQFKSMSAWLQFSFWSGASNSWTCKLGSVSRLNIFAKNGLPRDHLLWRPLGTFTTIGTEVFSWGTCNQVTVLGCGCERQSEQFAQRKTRHMNYIITHF